MSEKYEGWVIKSFLSGEPFLLYYTFRTTRTEAIRSMASMGDWYKKNRRKGNLKAVKIRFVEVTNV